MDILALFFFACLSILVGIILTLVLQYYALLRYFNKSPCVSPPRKPHSEACSLPEPLRKILEIDGYDSSNSSLAITLMLQFLFHELRHSDSIKRWLYKKLSLELEELITKTTTGKFFEAVTIRDMHLGSQFPTVKTIGVESVKLDKTEGHIDTLDLCIKLEYTGNFLLSVDAKMKFGKTAYLSIKVKHVSGTARLQFSRLPYTHWSFSFYSEPVLDLAVESHFQGRQLQSNITNLIVNQIKKAIKRKHTLPNYKIRYKPFFSKSDPGQLDLDDNEIIPQGQLEVMCLEMSRLAATPEISECFCTFAIDSTPWICIYQRDTITFLTLELTVSKVKQRQLGATFKQEQNLILVESIAPHSLADIAMLKVGDILLAVDGKTVTTITQLNKILKLLPIGNFSIRIERIGTDYIMKMKNELPTVGNAGDINESNATPEQHGFVLIDSKSKSIDYSDISKMPKTVCATEKPKSCDKIHIPKLITTSNENVSKFAQTIGNFTLRKRKTSVERIPTDGSNRSSPVQSTPGTPHHVGLKSSNKKTLFSSIDQDTCLSNSVKVYKGNLKELISVIKCTDEYYFNLKDTDKYLNINVWGLNGASKEILLGYINIPVAQVLNECNNSMLGHYIKNYSFLPPTSTPPTSQSHPLVQHSGFEHVFCYGDVLLSFMWTHDDVTEIKQKVSTSQTGYIKQFDTFESDIRHDFVRTQFHRTTHCDFCSKKIWLKDAVQCKNCDLCCHKKCVSRCLLSMPCILLDKSDTKAEPLDILQPEITMTEADVDLGCEISPFGLGDQRPISAGLKRVNSANNLAIPGSQVSQCQSRSLPPSPQYSPRKLSLIVSTPFGICPTILDELYQQTSDATDVISKAVEQVLLYPSDESLMDAAKESGMQMYINLQHEEKVEKINLMVTELKRTLDAATVEHMALCKKLGIIDSEVEKAKLAFLIGQADAKIQALSVLMLHYCSGLQYTQEKIV